MKRKLKGILLQRCPTCGKGAMYSGLLRMNLSCSVCDTRFAREEGYYTGSMYISYILGILITIPVWAVLFFTWQPMWITIVVPIIMLVVLAPVLYRYARTIWIYFDRAFDPGAEQLAAAQVPVVVDSLEARRATHR